MTGLVEMLILFGALLAFLAWELVSVNRALRRDAERKRQAPSEPGSTDGTGGTEANATTPAAQRE